MGQLREGINEVIATTRLNAAPMGIIQHDGSQVMAIYRTSHTAANIEKEDWVVAHITYDPVLFVTTAFSDPLQDAYIQEEIDGLTMYRLKDISNWIAFRTEIISSTPQKILVSLKPVKNSFSQEIPGAYNRGFSSVIEATVHGTRFLLSGSEDLKSLIYHHISLIERCGGPREREALDLLRTFIKL